MYAEKQFQLKKKILANRLNMGLPLPAWVKETIHKVETHSPVDKVLGTAIIKEGQVYNLLRHERNHYYWFHWKRCNCKQGFL